MRLRDLLGLLLRAARRRAIVRGDRWRQNLQFLQGEKSNAETHRASRIGSKTQRKGARLRRRPLPNQDPPSVAQVIRLSAERRYLGVRIAGNLP